MTLSEILNHDWPIDPEYYNWVHVADEELEFLEIRLLLLGAVRDHDGSVISPTSGDEFICKTYGPDDPYTVYMSEIVSWLKGTGIDYESI